MKYNFVWVLSVVTQIYQLIPCGFMSLGRQPDYLGQLVYDFKRYKSAENRKNEDEVGQTLGAFMVLKCIKAPETTRTKTTQDKH